MNEVNNEIILEINLLVSGYRSGKSVSPLIKPFSETLCRGELVAVIGQNGSGKSTLLRTIAGLIKPLYGKILLEGKRIEEYSKSEFAKKTGFVSTEQIRVDSMKVSDLVELGRYPYTSFLGKLNEYDREKISYAINKTGIQHLTERFVNEISDGERQKAMIARIIAQDTDLMILDEPTAFLDISNRFEIIHLLGTLSHERKQTIIFSTHDLQVVLNECDKLWLITEGKMHAGAPEDMIIKGLINRLLKHSNIVFNEDNASFDIKKDTGHKIFVSGKGSQSFWTEKALKRAGFSVSANEYSEKVVAGEDSKGYFWIFIDEKGSRQETRTIYDLIKIIRRRLNTRTL